MKASFSRISIILGLALVACLYGEEALHYQRGLYHGAREYYVVRTLDYHPGCTLRDNNPREIICPVAAYNTVRLGCLTQQCVPEDQDAPAITPESVERYRLRMLAEFGRPPRDERTWDQTP